MKKTALAATLTCALLLAVSLASPAFGGPSIGGVAKKAAKALRIGKSAKKTANRALAEAGRVRTVTLQQEVAAAPGTFAEFDLRCPRGYVPTGHGIGNGALDPVFTGPVPDGFIAALSNLGGSDTYSGILYVICANGAWLGQASATMSRPEARRAMESAEQAAVEAAS